MTDRKRSGLLSRQTIVMALKTLMTFFLLYVIYRFLDSDEFLGLLHRMDYRFVALGVLAMWFNILVAAFRWQVLLRFFRIVADYFTCLRIYAEAVTINLVLPGSVGGDVFRVYELGRTNGRYWATLSAVLADRFGSLLVLIVFCCALLLRYSIDMQGFDVFVWLLAAAVVAGFVFTYAFPVYRSWMRVPVYRYLVRMIYIVKRMFAGPFRTFAVLGLSVAVQFSIFLAMYFSMAAVSRDLAQFDLAVFATTLATLAATLPITLAGFGVREGAIVVTLYFFRIEPAQAAAVAAVFSFCVFIQCMPGAVSWGWRTFADYVPGRGAAPG